LRLGSICIALALSSGLPARGLDQKTKLEQLFLWKISEELKLSIKEEKQLGEIIQDLDHQRQELSEKIQEQIKEMSLEKNPAKLEKALLQYKKNLKLQAELNTDEIDRVKKALGVSKAAQYLFVKSELSIKVKGLLLSPGDKGKE
jgi:hypothetical protein